MSLPFQAIQTELVSKCFFTGQQNVPVLKVAVYQHKRRLGIIQRLHICWDCPQSGNFSSGDTIMPSNNFKPAIRLQTDTYRFDYTMLPNRFSQFV